MVLITIPLFMQTHTIFNPNVLLSGKAIFSQPVPKKSLYPKPGVEPV